ncbi:MAG: hypothetical protein AAF849_21440, partial [Bacteroidota bacterium]
SGVYSEEEIKSIIFVSNQMMSMRMQANTVFRDYIDALVVIKNGVADSEQRLAEWQNVLNQILEGIVNKKTRVYTNFLKFSKKFYESGALRASQRATSWTARQSNYSVKYADKQPYVEFESTDLIAVRLKDSIQIHQTSGRYFPTSEEWIGKSGTVKWSDRFSDLGEDVYAEFPDTFRIQMNTSLYSVQNAKLKYPLYFGDKFIRGTFEDKIVSDSKDADYPKFESNKKILNIDNIGQGIYFVGGFRLNGLTVYGYGTKEKRANLKIYDDKEERLIYEGSSERVIIKRGEFLIGNDVESNIYFNQDSIYHPAVNIRFNIEDKTLQLNRIKEGNGKNPFFSSVHKMNFDAENIFVYFRKDSVEIGKRGIAFDTKKEVYFESLKFFSEGEYLRNKGISDYSAIDIIAVTSEREDTKVIDADLIASRINSKFTGENIKGELYELVAGGFIDYDDEKQIIYVKEKLLHYANANQGKVDFDPLRIMSDTEDVNATLNLKNSEISATGIRAIEFSRKQRVAILPDSSNVTIRENRDMNFDGKLFAGFSTITGKGFDFEYDRYLIDLDSVQYFDLYIPTGELDERNQPVALPLGSRIEGLNGVLLIDAPSNKSGREDIEIFPSFQSKQKSYVYYDQKEIRQGVYKRDSFYFELDKFSFNHLDKFTARDIIFPGTLYSFDIMAPFEESLIVRDEDQSLGFTHSTPEAGYALYKEKGNYMGIIDLSNRGLTGEGDLTYLGATVFSDDIVFKPYQLTASAKTFEHAENRTDEVQTPKISGLDAAIDWRPYKDSMYVQTKEKPFEVYQSAEHTLDGTLILTPGGVKGIGKLDWSKAAMNSPLFAFGANSVTADTTTLNIKAEDGTETALSTKDMNANVDFDEGQAAFEANTEKAITKLPYNRYETSINSFAWDMNAEEVRFQSDASKLGTFLSVHPDQDSLRFKGQSAFYDLKTNELQIGGIPHIVAADAFIYPDSSSVTVLPEAVITTLENAKIVADTVNQNHVINRATVNILGKRLYTASGFYEYNIGNNKQEIEFSEIKGEPVGKGKYKEKRVATRATGTVAAEDSFYIDLKTEFQGTISLSSDSKALFFDGFARLDEEKLPQRQWFRLRSEGNKEDLIIKYNEPKNQEGVPLETGFFLSKETGIAYPSMMGILAFRKDRALLPVKGRMKLDPKRDEFIFADSSKMVNLDALTGNKLVFSNKTGKIRGEGKFDIGSGLKYIDIEAAGFMNTEMVPVDSGGLMPNYQVDAEFMATVDLILPDKLLDIMVKDLRSAAFESQAINFIKEPNFYRKATSELFPSNKEIDLAIQEVNRGALNLPAKHNNHTFVFAKLPMKWNTEYQSFVTKGSKVGLVSIKGELFNYVYKGYVECRMPTNGDDRLYIYLESPTGTSYYFGFKQGILSITSSNTAFIQAAEALKAKEVILKMDDGETYEIQLVSPGISNMFINRVKAAQK